MAGFKKADKFASGYTKLAVYKIPLYAAYPDNYYYQECETEFELTLLFDSKGKIEKHYAKKLSGLCDDFGFSTVFANNATEQNIIDAYGFANENDFIKLADDFNCIRVENHDGISLYEHCGEVIFYQDKSWMDYLF
jgi:hypothetical protein